ncbi:Pca operon regulatory protein [compost metagenome]
MQSCHLSILYMNQVMVVLHAKSPGPIALSIEEGNLFPLLLTASGKVLLSYLPDDEQSTVMNNNVIFQAFSDKEKAKFIKSLKEIKDKGAYIRTSDLAAGVIDISVPIGKGNTGIIACLTVSSLTALNVNKDIDNEDILAEAIKCAERIEQRIGL